MLALFNILLPVNGVEKCSREQKCGHPSDVLRFEDDLAFQNNNAHHRIFVPFFTTVVKSGDRNFLVPSNQQLLGQWEEKTRRKVDYKEACSTRLSHYGEKLLKRVQDKPHHSLI